jgi:hypothetical protein
MINEINKVPQINIYPNPAINFFQISSNETGPVNISIYDMPGKLLFKWNLKTLDRIDISELNTGMYNVIIQFQNKTLIEKLMISK